jgi:hypothetical protein
VAQIIITAIPIFAAVLATQWVMARRYQQHGQIECAWKGFDAPGRWRHGLATVSRGSFQFQPRLGPIGTRIPKGEPVSVVVESMDPDLGRRPGLSHMWHLNPRLHILTMRTPTEAIAIAMLPKRIPVLRTRLGI